jgi:hypothetical protein
MRAVSEQLDAQGLSRRQLCSVGRGLFRKKSAKKAGSFSTEQASMESIVDLTTRGGQHVWHQRCTDWRRKRLQVRDPTTNRFVETENLIRQRKKALPNI